MAGLAVFAAASLAGGLATSDTLLIVMRGMQGLGAALVLPAALSIVMNMFSEGAERNKALGIWGGVGALGGTTGLLAGGILVHHGYATAAALTGGFQWALWVCGPTSLAAIPVAFLLIRRTRKADVIATAQSQDLVMAATR